MKRLIPLGTVAILLIGGCGSKPAASSGPPAAAERDALAKRLSTMTPEERAAYVSEHPEAAQKLSGQPSNDTP